MQKYIGETKPNFALQPNVPLNSWFISAISDDIWINTTEQLTCVNWTDETVLTIFYVWMSKTLLIYPLQVD